MSLRVAGAFVFLTLPILLLIRLSQYREDCIKGGWSGTNANYFTFVRMLNSTGDLNPIIITNSAHNNFTGHCCNT